MAERVADRLARYRPPALLARHRGAHRQLVERRARRQAEAQRALFILVVADALLDDLGKGPAEQFVQRRSEEHTSELQSLMRRSYAVFCLKKKNNKHMKTENIYDNK